MSIEGAINPNLQVQNQLNFEEAVNQSGNDKQYIYVKGSQVNREGAFSHLFTRKSVNVATTQALQNEILQNYGKDASDALSSRFDQFIRSKEQLTVGMAKELFAEAKALQKNSEKLRELQESLKDLDPLIKNVLSPKIDSLIANGAPHDQVTQMIRDVARILQNDLDAIHAQADQVIQDNKNWSPETQQLFKDTLESFITEKPWNLDKDSKDVAIFMQEIPRVINNQMGNGDVFSKVKNPTDQRDLLQMIASITLTNPDSPRQAALLQALPKIRDEQPNGLIRSDTIYKAVIGKEAPGNFENLSSIHADHVFNEGFKQMCEKRSGLDSSIFQEVWGDFSILTAMGIPFDLALERSVELVKNPNSVHPIDITKLNLSTEVNFKSGDYSIERGEKQFGGTSGDFKRMPKRRPVGKDQKMVDTFPSVTIGLGDKAQTIIGALKPEEAAKRADTIMQLVKDLCNENKEQYRLSLWLLTQSSPLKVMIVAGSKYIGPIQLDEHTPLNYAFTKSENGDITVSMKLPEGLGYKAEATHVLHPDGTAETTNFVFKSE